MLRGQYYVNASDERYVHKVPLDTEELRIQLEVDAKKWFNDLGEVSLYLGGNQTSFGKIFKDDNDKEWSKLLARLLDDKQNKIVTLQSRETGALSPLPLPFAPITANVCAPGNTITTKLCFSIHASMSETGKEIKINPTIGVCKVDRDVEDLGSPVSIKRSIAGIGSDGDHVLHSPYYYYLKRHCSPVLKFECTSTEPLFERISKWRSVFRLEPSSFCDSRLSGKQVFLMVDNDNKNQGDYVVSVYFQYRDKVMDRQAVQRNPSAQRYLICDLDHTLIHCNKNIGERRRPDNEQLVFISGYGEVVVRKKAGDFLRSAQWMGFEIFVCTAGTRYYGIKIFEHLFPFLGLDEDHIFSTRDYFGDEEVCKGYGRPANDFFAKKDIDFMIPLQNGTTNKNTLIIDDTVLAWVAKQSDHVILVTKYVAGRAPNDQSMESLKSKLLNLLNKSKAFNEYLEERNKELDHARRRHNTRRISTLENCINLKKSSVNGLVDHWSEIVKEAQAQLLTGNPNLQRQKHEKRLYVVLDESCTKWQGLKKFEDELKARCDVEGIALLKSDIKELKKGEDLFYHSRREVNNPWVLLSLNQTKRYKAMRKNRKDGTSNSLILDPNKIVFTGRSHRDTSLRTILEQCGNTMESTLSKKMGDIERSRSRSVSPEFRRQRSERERSRSPMPSPGSNRYNHRHNHRSSSRSRSPSRTWRMPMQNGRNLECRPRSRSNSPFVANQQHRGGNQRRYNGRTRRGSYNGGSRGGRERFDGRYDQRARGNSYIPRNGGSGGDGEWSTGYRNRR
jgi:hypothetical protein